MANIKPLRNKYYGTVVQLNNGDTIDVWLGPNTECYRASEREIANGWTPDMGFDHVETEESYKVAKIICDALTKEGY